MLQVQRKRDGAWCHLVDPRSGLTLHLDVVSVSDTSDEELHGIANGVMESLGNDELKRRVLFFPGDRREVTARKEFPGGKVAMTRRAQKLTVDDAYAIVEEGSDSTALGRRQFTWALQEAVGKAVHPSGWRMARAGARGETILAGDVSFKPGFTNADWADAGPGLLQHVVSASGAPGTGVYRLMIWEGVIPKAELDPARCVATIPGEPSSVSASATTYHYRLQVERRFGGWVSPADRRTGAIVAGCYGDVEAPEGDLAGIAGQVMERSGAGWSRRRVVFVSGSRGQHEALRDDEVFGIVADAGGTLALGPAHPGFVPGTRPSFGPQPQPLGSEPWKDHGLADRQLVECGSCRAEVTVRLVEGGTVFFGTVENMRGAALICGGCGRILCADCALAAVGRPFERPATCDRCGGKVGPLQAPDGQATRDDPATSSGLPVEDARTYAGCTAAEVAEHVVACRQARRHGDRTVQRILDELRREYGHPAYPFAASLERLAYGTAGPPLYQESMEPDEVQLIEAIMQRLEGSALSAGPDK